MHTRRFESESESESRSGECQSVIPPRGWTGFTRLRRPGGERLRASGCPIAEGGIGGGTRVACWVVVTVVEYCGIDRLRRGFARLPPLVEYRYTIILTLYERNRAGEGMCRGRDVPGPYAHTLHTV